MPARNKQLFLAPLLFWLIGHKLAALVRANTKEEDGQPCLIGIPTAGTTLAQAASMASYQRRVKSPQNAEEPLISFRVMREALKTAHGTHSQWVDGDYDVRQTYWLVDNAVTSGQSIIQGRKRLHESYPAKDTPCLILVDRQQGGVERLQKEGFSRVVVAYKLLELAETFEGLGYWPKGSAKKVEEEIQAHQLA